MFYWSVLQQSDCSIREYQTVYSSAVLNHHDLKHLPAVAYFADVGLRIFLSKQDKSCHIVQHLFLMSNTSKLCNVCPVGICY